MIYLNNNTIKNIINIVMKKNINFGNKFPIILENSINKNIFLQKKRPLENHKLNYNNVNSILKDSNFFFSNKNNINIHKNEFKENNQILYGSTLELIRPNFSFCDYNYNVNLNESSKTSNNLIPTVRENKIENYFIISNIYNVNNNFNENLNNDFLNNNSKLNNDNNKDYFRANLNDNYNNSIDCSKIINHSNNTSNFMKKNYFNVIHIKKERCKKKIKQINVNQIENNNEIKVLKNNKVVYVNSFLLNSYTTSKNIKKFNKITFIGRNKRSSKYRGVSKNGNQWQVLMMINKNKSYIGSYPSEELAARIYDILALKNRGIKARTNFIYNSKQIKKICQMEIDIKSEKINDIISQLIE